MSLSAIMQYKISVYSENGETIIATNLVGQLVDNMILI